MSGYDTNLVMERIEAERIKDEQNASGDVVETNRMDDIKEPVTLYPSGFRCPCQESMRQDLNLRPLRPESANGLSVTPPIPFKPFKINVFSQSAFCIFSPYFAFFSNFCGQNAVKPKPA